MKLAGTDTVGTETSTPSDEAAETPAGTMIVPIDAWNKMLNQLGNLHEAGQQLAEARERAAKAETEATFLRERLAEIRQEDSGAAVSPPSAPQPEREPKSEESSEPEPDVPSTPPHPPEKVWQYLVRRLRDR